MKIDNRIFALLASPFFVYLFLRGFLAFCGVPVDQDGRAVMALFSLIMMGVLAPFMMQPSLGPFLGHTRIGRGGDKEQP